MSSRIAEIECKRKNLILALKFNMISWFQFLDDWRKLYDEVDYVTQKKIKTTATISTTPRSGQSSKG
jgi:hypothetical protein